MFCYRFLAMMPLAFLPRAERRRVWQSDEKYIRGLHLPTEACIHHGPARMRWFQGESAGQAENAGSIFIVQTLTQAQRDQPE